MGDRWTTGGRQEDDGWTTRGRQEDDRWTTGGRRKEDQEDDGRMTGQRTNNTFARMSIARNTDWLHHRDSRLRLSASVELLQGPDVSNDI